MWVEIVLSGEERAEVEWLVRAHTTGQQLAVRARLVPRAAEGLAEVGPATKSTRLPGLKSSQAAKCAVKARMRAAPRQRARTSGRAAASDRRVARHGKPEARARRGSSRP